LDKRWKNLVIVVLALGFISVAAYFLLTYKPQPSKNTFEDLKAIWVAYGIKADYLNDAYTELSNLSNEELTSLKYQLESFRKQSNVLWLRDLAAIYSTGVDIELTQRRVSALKEKIAKLKNSCDNIALFTNLLSEQERVVSLVKQYERKLKEFSKNYPQNFEKLHLRANVNSAELNRMLSMQRALVAGLQGVCG
jgi:myosin heavy subunit